MGDEWIERAIGDIGEVVGGSTPSTKDTANFDGDIPWLTPKDLSGPHPRYVARGERNLSQLGLESCSAKLLPKNAVLLSSRAPIGYVAIAANPLATNQGFRSLVLKPEYDHEFVYYWLSANVEQLERHASGSTFKELSGTSLKQIRIRLPREKAEQRAIAHILGTLDDKIELNRKQNETLEAMARALFRAWFVDFEPVRAKMEGRWQRGQSLPGLPAHLYDLFPDRLVETELGEIPEGCGLKKIGDVITRLSVGKKYEQKTVSSKGCVPVLDQGKSGIIGYHNGEPGVVATPDAPVVVFANHTCYMRIIGFSFSTIQNVLPFKGKDVSTIWVYYATLGKQSFVEYKGHWPDFVIHDIVIPPINLTEQFAKLVHYHLKLIWENERESRTLAALRDTLLPKLISGELRVPDAEKFVESAGHQAVSQTRSMS